MHPFPAASTPAQPDRWHEPDSELLSLVEDLATEMVRLWRRGERPCTEEFLGRRPELWQQPEAALELIGEELTLRQETGAGVDLAELQRRFPQWRRQVEILARCHDLLTTLPPPGIGETLGEFRLLAELGRGAAGRVYLASQPSLAGRPVVLKLCPGPGEECLSLARLQHTHIVPLFSVHDFPAYALHGLCHPYLGGATLADLLAALNGRRPTDRTGRHLLDALRGAQVAAPVTLPVAGPACRFLDQASYVHAVCWLCMCLAEALHYAHERGLLHLDVKPSNVLLAADGQPLLLDFHLAREVIPAGASPPPALGGTPEYMPPEQRAAVDAVRERRPISADVDTRADVYALGVVLFEALAGTLPGPGQTLRGCNPKVTSGLAAVVSKCLAPEAQRRYASAADLAADLRRYLADLPLRGVANRNPVERWRCWRRRHPYALPLLGLAVITAVAMALLFGHAQKQAARASSARRQTEEAGRAEFAQAAGELHAACEQLRRLRDAAALTEEQAHCAEALCARLWQDRAHVIKHLGRLGSPDLSEQIRLDLLDVALLWCDLHVRRQSTTNLRRAHEEAVQVLDQADAILGPSGVIVAARRALERPNASRSPAVRADKTTAIPLTRTRGHAPIP